MRLKKEEINLFCGVAQIDANKCARNREYREKMLPLYL